MSPLPLLLAAALLADPPPAEPRPELAPAGAVSTVPADPPPEPPPASAPASYRMPGDRLLSFSGGMAVGRYDDIPITLVLVRGSIVALKAAPEGRGARPGFGVSLEAFGGRTQRGLGVGGFTVGPGIWIALGPLRGGATAELGFQGIEKATYPVTEYLMVGLLRATAELDLWRGEDATPFLGASGWVGNGNGIPMRAASAFVGVRL